MRHLENIRISPQVLNLIAEIDEFKGAWNALESHTTALQILGDVANFGQNFKNVTEPWQDRPLDEDVIRTLHGVFTGNKGISAYKTRNFPLVVQAGERIVGSLDTAAPEEVAALMPKLVQWLDGALEDRTFHPLLVTAVFTAVFLQLCPFEAGNQRLAWLMIVLLMLKSGYGYAPYVPLDHLLNERIQDYYEVLAHTQGSVEEGQADWEPWLVFFLRLLKDQKDQLKERIEDKGDALADMPALSSKIMALFEENKRLQMKEIERLTRGRRSTLKLRLNELVEGGYLKRHGQARATWYSRV